MAVNNNTTLAGPPSNIPMVDTKTGMVTQQWAMWFEQMFVRIGGLAPINPAIASSPLVVQYALNFYISSTQTGFNGFLYAAGVVIPFFLSALGVTTVIDSLTVQNNSPFDASFDVWVVPYQQVPGSLNQIAAGVTVSAGSTVSLQQIVNKQVGSGGYVVIRASSPNALLCTLSGRQVT